MKQSVGILILIVCVAIVFSDCSGGGGGGLSSGLGELGNPGADGPVKINLKLLDDNLTVEQGSSIDFRVAAEFKNLGDNSQGTTVTAECPYGSNCTVSRLPQSSGGTVTVTVHVTHQLEVGQHTIRVLGKESHYGALGGLGGLAVYTKKLEVRLDVTEGDSRFAFNPWTIRLEANARPMPIHALELEWAEQLITGGPYRQLMGYYFENCASNCSAVRQVVEVDDQTFGEGTWNLNAAKATDYNSDGLPDILLTSSNGLTILPASDEKVFIKPELFTFNYPIHSLKVADLNGDGVNDFIGSAPSGGKMALFFMKRSGEVATTLELDTAAGAERFSVGDIDADGDQDIAVLNPAGGLDIYLNDSDGRFVHSAHLIESRSFADIEMFDFDNDLASDIVLSDTSLNRVLVVFGGSDIQVLRQIDLDEIDAPENIATGDFNSDGLQDIAVLSPRLSRIAVFAGYGADHFDAPVFVTTEIGCAEGENCNRSPMYLEAGDFNQDGISDLATVVPSTACLSRCPANYGTLIFQLADPNR